MMYDFAIIGGGVVGCAILHELSNQGYHCVLLEKNDSLATGASGGNSAHFVAVPWGLVMEYDSNPIEMWCVQQCIPLIKDFCQKCDIPVKMLPTLIVAWTPEETQKLAEILATAQKQATAARIRAVSREELLRLEPGLSRAAHGALLIEGAAVIDSHLLTIMLAHQAVRRGAKVLLKSEVTGGAQAAEGTWQLQTRRGPVQAKIVVNAAGLHGDEVEAIRGESSFRIKPRKGQFVVYGKEAGKLLNHAIMRVPSEMGRGIHVNPSVYGNLVVGPTATDVQERDQPAIDNDTTAQLVQFGHKVLPALKDYEIIGTYAGLRPATETKDYHIHAYSGRNWITVGGIRSTGVSACLGIAKYVLQVLYDKKLIKPSRSSSLVMPDTVAPYWRTQKPSVVLDGVEYTVTHPLMKMGLQVDKSASKSKL